MVMKRRSSEYYDVAPFTAIALLDDGKVRSSRMRLHGRPLVSEFTATTIVDRGSGRLAGPWPHATELEEAAEVEEPTSGSGAGDSGKRATAGEMAMAVAC
jgi:hypothetical protein